MVNRRWDKMLEIFSLSLGLLNQAQQVHQPNIHYIWLWIMTHCVLTFSVAGADDQELTYPATHTLQRRQLKMKTEDEEENDQVFFRGKMRKTAKPIQDEHTNDNVVKREPRQQPHWIYVYIYSFLNHRVSPWLLRTMFNI